MYVQAGQQTWFTTKSEEVDFSNVVKSPPRACARAQQAAPGGALVRCVVQAVEIVLEVCRIADDSRKAPETDKVALFQALHAE